tara:strand:- start:255 stop:491 length:237 start_codon:yes stop_codon:yes gene_type:complete
MITFTNKDDAEKIQKLLGLKGDDPIEVDKYYCVSDALIALMHFCDHLKEGDEFNHDFETHLEAAREGYASNIYDEEGI